MPMINIEYDNNVVSDSDAESISKAIKDIVSEETGIEDVFVYTNTSTIKVKVAPIEIFIRMTRTKIKDDNFLVSKIKTKIKGWKKLNSFQHPVNLTLIPMDWKVEIGI